MSTPPTPDGMLELIALRRAVEGVAGRLDRHPGDLVSLLTTALLLDGSEAAVAAVERLVPPDRPLLRIREQRSLAIGAAAVVVEELDEQPTALAVLPDGASLLVGGDGGSIQARHPGETSMTSLAWLSAGVRAIQPSADGGPILVLTDDGVARLIDAEGGILYSVAPDGGTQPTAATGLSGGQGLALGYADGRVVISSPEAESLTLIGHGAAVRLCVALADGRSLLTASDDCTLRLWDLGSGQMRARLVGHPAAITACDCHAEAGRLLSADADGGLRLWDCEGRDLGHLPGHQAAVTACRLSRDASQAVSISRDGTLRFWDCRERSEIGRWRSHDGAVLGLLPLSGGFDRERPQLGSGGPGEVVTWGDDGVLRVRELATGRERLAYRPSRGRPLAVAVLDEQIVIATTDATLETVRPPTDEAPGVKDRSGDWVGFAIDSDAGSGFALHRGQVVWWSELPPHEPRLFPMGYSPGPFFCRRLSGRRSFVMLGESGLVTELVTNESDSVASPFETHGLDLGGRRPSAAAVTESAGSVNLCFGFDNGEVMVAVMPDTEQEAPVPWDLRAHPSAVTTLAVDASQHVLLTGHADGACLLFDFETGERINRFHDLPQAVTASAVLLGNGFMIGCANGEVHWWRLDSTKPFFITHQHDGAVNDCVAGADGRWAITAGEDATLRYWSLDDGRCVETFHGDAPFSGLQLDTSGGRLWALDRIGVLRAFDVSLFEPEVMLEAE